MSSPQVVGSLHLRAAVHLATPPGSGATDYVPTMNPLKGHKGAPPAYLLSLARWLGIRSDRSLSSARRAAHTCSADAASRAWARNGRWPPWSRPVALPSGRMRWARELPARFVLVTGQPGFNYFAVDGHCLEDCPLYAATVSRTTPQRLSNRTRCRGSADVSSTRTAGRPE